MNFEKCNFFIFQVINFVFPIIFLGSDSHCRESRGVRRALGSNGRVYVIRGEVFYRIEKKEWRPQLRIRSVLFPSRIPRSPYKYLLQFTWLVVYGGKNDGQNSGLTRWSFLRTWYNRRLGCATVRFVIRASGSRHPVDVDPI